ncbi:MAG: serine/threonine protein kinase [Deltaproteobacteria bacterium]|nr:serine/threonine protein kinase [Deltaproteobacteria bacterium]
MQEEKIMIGDYRVIKPIGKGGMAEVFAVEKSGPAGFEKQLCLKRIRREHAHNKEFVASFESEARIVSRLQHPNIVQVFDFFKEDGDLCLVMELIEGMDLNGMLRMINDFGLLLPADVAVYILESLLLALLHAHHLHVNDEEVCVIHRDISPHNLLVSKAGEVKLADFGIAKAKGISQDTPSGVLKGKLTYLAPERLQMGKVPIGPESDLFSAGIIFWEMLAKERLFKATMEHEVLARVMNFEKAPIEHLHPRMNQFLEKILAPKPKDRFHSAQEARDALKRIGVRPCSQGDMAKIVTRLLAVKEMAASYQELKEAAYSPSTMSVNQTEPFKVGTIVRDANEDKAVESVVDNRRASRPSRIKRHRNVISRGIAVIAFATVLMAIFGIWRNMSKATEDTETVEAALETVQEVNAHDENTKKKPVGNPVMKLKASVPASTELGGVLHPHVAGSNKCKNGSLVCEANQSQPNIESEEPKNISHNPKHSGKKKKKSATVKDNDNTKKRMFEPLVVE